jgi:hypothetical protein
MLTMLVKWTAGAALLGSLFWCSARDCVTLLLAIWTILIASFVYSNLKDRFLGIPVFLAAAGVLGSIFVLAIPSNITLAANVAVLVTFVVSLEVLKKKRFSSIAYARHRALMKASP